MKLVLLIAIAMTWTSVSNGQEVNSKQASPTETEQSVKSQSVDVLASIIKVLDNGKKQATLAIKKTTLQNKKSIRIGNLGDTGFEIEITPHIIKPSKTTTNKREIESTTTKNVNVNQDDSGTLRRTVVYRLTNAPANDVAVSINNYYEKELMPPLVIPELVSNSLIVTSKGKTQANQVETLVKALDSQPPQVKFKIKVYNVDDNGKSILIQPPVSILTVDNLQSTTEIHVPNTTLKIQLLARVRASK